MDYWNNKEPLKLKSGKARLGTSLGTGGMTAPLNASGLSGPMQKPRKGRSSTKWPEAYQWLATGALMVWSAVGLRMVPPAHAQQPPVPGGGEPPKPIPSPERFRFEVEPGPLDVVLRAFETVTGWQVTLPNAGMADLHSPGVSGAYTGQEALERLLSDTGATFRLTGPEAVSLELRGLRTSIEVRATPTPSLPMYTESLRETPQTIMIIPKTIMEEQGATTLRDALRNVPGLTVVAGEGGAPAGDNLTLRGFSARNDIFVDGVRDLSPQARDTFSLEQVEVAKGPTSAVSGRGSTGGTVNMVSKTPGLNRILAGTAQFGTDKTKRVTGDINLPFRDRYAFRLNLLAHESAVAGRDIVDNSRWGVAPSLSLGLGTPTRFTFAYQKLKQSNLSDYGIPWVPANNNVLFDYRDQPAPVPRENFYGYKDRDHEKTNSDMGTFRFERLFGDSTTLKNQLRYGRSTRDSIATPPRFNSPDTAIINREMRSWLTRDQVLDNQTDLIADFKTGGISHSFVAGSAFTGEWNIRRLRSAPNGLTTLFNPNPYDVYDGVITESPDAGDVSANTQALYAFDHVRLSRRWAVSGGLRWERFDASGVTTNLIEVGRVDTMLSGRAALIFDPTTSGTVYVSYGSAMNPSLESLAYVSSNNNNLDLEPEKSYTLELGAKWDLLNGRLMVSGAIFQVDKTNARTPGLLPDDPVQVLEGKQRVKGVELGVMGRLTRRWNVSAAYTYLDARIRESNNPVEVGNWLPQTPDNSFSSWTTYALPFRLTLGGGLRYVGRRYNNTANIRSVEGYWSLDAMASFPVARFLDLQVNAYNLTDTYYFDRVGGGHVVPGAARSVSIATAFRF